MTLYFKNNNIAMQVTKLRFFSDARQAYGRSALLLSGGGSLGLYHFGVVKRLYECGLLPRVISGSSIGALVAVWEHCNLSASTMIATCGNDFVGYVF